MRSFAVILVAAIAGTQHGVHSIPQSQYQQRPQQHPIRSYGGPTARPHSPLHGGPNVPPHNWLDGPADAGYNGPEKTYSDGYFMSWRDLHPSYLYSWKQADEECTSRGYRLVSLDTAQKDHYVSDKMEQDDIKFTWTSGVRGYDGYFRWGTGAKVNDRYYTNWARAGNGIPAQPDNRKYPEDCLTVADLGDNIDIAWHDVQCSERKHFVCEKYL